MWQQQLCGLLFGQVLIAKTNLFRPLAIETMWFTFITLDPSLTTSQAPSSRSSLDYSAFVDERVIFVVTTLMLMKVGVEKKMWRR